MCAVKNKGITDLSNPRVKSNLQIHIRGSLIQSHNTQGVCLPRESLFWEIQPHPPSCIYFPRDAAMASGRHQNTHFPVC